MMKPVISGKLTKQFLLSLEMGLYIVSNVHDQVESGRHVPCFREEVMIAEARDEQWERIKSAHANGRLCDVFACKSDYEAYRKLHPIPGN